MYLYNSATRTKELFKPRFDGKVSMYTCGPTVYHFAHIGNLRTYTMEDVLEKYLRYLGTLGARGENLQATVLMEMLDGIFRPANTEKRERYFSKLSNTVKTDLSIVDYSAAEEGIKAFMQSGIKKKVIVDSYEEMREE